MKKQAGFTLIELVMVIVILGILAAVALPKFVNLASDARVAALKGVEGAMRSANAMIYAKAAVSNKMGANGNLSTTEIPGATSDVNIKYGFAADLNQLKKVMDLSNDFSIDVDTYLILQHTGALTPADCRVSYVVATGTTLAPSYTHEYSGC